MSTPYLAPLPLIRLALNQAADAAGARSLEGYAEVLSDLAEPILESAARFAGDVLSPLNVVGDRTPSRRESHGVVTPPGFIDAYRRFREDGWASLAAPEEYGGQGLPTLVAAAVTEMWGGANLSFAMCPELTVGALEAMRVHGSARLNGAYAPHLASGEWATAMCLTEPQAGSDLSTLRTRAEPDGDAWRLFGRKIYISWGDHDLTDNIVHFVLARTPGAPAGLKGISLFLVPKKVPAAGGALEKNDIDAVSLEHKMGIRASPTCVMVLGESGGARGWLIGRLNDGLGCMFTMMNHMRLGVGLHSLGLAERALQLARAYARERLQGRDATGAQRRIIEHADVRRMLLMMKSLTQAARGLAYTAAATLDVVHRGGAVSGGPLAATDTGGRAATTTAATTDAARGSGDAARRQTDTSGGVAAPSAAARRVDLLTPVVKAWCSDVGVEVASLGVQIHGGMGYVDDAEISQVYRDARIGPIFEGTNYIQAQDLLARKVIRDKGVALGELLDDIEAAARALDALTAPTPVLATAAHAAPTRAPARTASAHVPKTTAHAAPAHAPKAAARTAPAHAESLALLRSGLSHGCAALRKAAAALIEEAPHEPDLVGATAHHFLQWVGVLAGGWQLALSAKRALSDLDATAAQAVVDMAAFYAAHVLPRMYTHEAAVTHGTRSVVSASTAEL